jgi:hypothetical protein
MAGKGGCGVGLGSGGIIRRHRGGGSLGGGSLGGGSFLSGTRSFSRVCCSTCRSFLLGCHSRLLFSGFGFRGFFRGSCFFSRCRLSGPGLFSHPLFIRRAALLGGLGLRGLVRTGCAFRCGRLSHGGGRGVPGVTVGLCAGYG